MIVLCLALFLNTDGQKNAINISEIVAIEDNVHETKIYMSRSGVSLKVKEDYDVVIQKLKDTARGCKL